MDSAVRANKSVVNLLTPQADEARANVNIAALNEYIHKIIVK
tara:strand:- start:297 stop:422 length:126 start_codon:yes stop_codon:yes gene_type:complete